MTTPATGSTSGGRGLAHAPEPTYDDIFKFTETELPNYLRSKSSTLQNSQHDNFKRQLITGEQFLTDHQILSSGMMFYVQTMSNMRLDPGTCTLRSHNSQN
jgi:hypothetical protein